ncbi:hypothetical protein [Chitinophaga nivalis]|uniref:DUF4149 domain-containing protein n=1 Tax=Chitinophaga nivalis TaxID=2991709 RepID=A0ABT3IMT8_9BACT|nr:hypothetical protein [Chitinophaga nivalis]MCW3465035.1 hypothetical protein [Chitinophaga nivalis]MCW3485273.1 hypothetical protein [Chitinophaga nivalis]
MMNYTLLLHGFLTMLIGNLAGVGYSKAIRNKIPNENGWKLLHTASVMGGIMLMVMAVFFNELTKDFRYAVYLFYSVILSNYCFAAGMLWAALTAARGLDKKEPGRHNRIVYIFYYIAATLSFVYTLVFIVLILNK